MSCEEGKVTDDVMEKTKQLCSARLKKKSKLLAFPYSFSRREQVFRKTNKNATLRVKGGCSVARGWYGWYQSFFLMLKDQYLMMYASEADTMSAPIYSIHLVGASLKVNTRNGVTIKSSKTTYWFKWEGSEEFAQWLYAFQHVPGLYRRFTDFYEIGETCGRGATCLVQKCTSRLTGLCFAVKSRIDPFDEIGRHGMYNELRILQILAKDPHPTVPVLEDYFFDKNGDIKIVMELMNGGDLIDMIEREQCLTEDRTRELFFQIADGVCHLHQNCIAHRDIKPSNIMTTEHSNGSLQCKIIDYDLAKENYAEHWFAHNPCGTAEYMAPELLEHKLYTLAIDVWSLGCVLYGMLAGHCPFRGANYMETRSNILHNKINLEALDKLSKKARDLVLQMLEPCPERRLTIREVLEHPWMTPARSCTKE